MIAETCTCSGDEARVDDRRLQLAAVCGSDELTVLCQIGWCCAINHQSELVGDVVVPVSARQAVLF